NTADITVNDLPTVTLSAFSDVCVDAAEFALSGGSPANGTYSGTGVSSGQFDPATAGVGTHTITYTYTDPNGCTSSNTADITVNNLPEAPVGEMLLPECTDTTFSVKVTNPHPGYTYSIDQEPNDIVFKDSIAPAVGDVVFTGLKFGDGYVLTVMNDNGCTSNPEDCGGFLVASEVSGGAVLHSAHIGKSASLQEPVSTEFTVKAYPNPFTNQVKFEVNIPEEGNGSLELYNMLGQKVKTIHEGHLNAGINTFEVNMPGQNSNTLIYMLRKGDKQLSGKLLQIER
ncbi:T9SS type A sorting domain-containing protein, partial [Maribellus sediminis]|uniref:T9SS type A sorting domain-containing protein n=1 Tax=Maribellus sediminis TaxID=2696285 RepID=UPI00142F535A